jgi:hypothetical protein
MVVYFNPWYLFIEGINAALIVGIVWLAWPPRPWSARERAVGGR